MSGFGAVTALGRGEKVTTVMSIWDGNDEGARACSIDSLAELWSRGDEGILAAWGASAHPHRFTEAAEARAFGGSKLASFRDRS